jgi:hypothetical protein
MMMTVYANYLPVYIHSSYVMTMHFIFFWRVIHHYSASNGYHKRRTMVNAVDTYTLAVVIRNHDNSVLIYIYIYICVSVLCVVVYDMILMAWFQSPIRHSHDRMVRTMRRMK